MLLLFFFSPSWSDALVGCAIFGRFRFAAEQVENLANCLQLVPSEVHARFGTVASVNSIKLTGSALCSAITVNFRYSMSVDDDDGTSMDKGPTSACAARDVLVRAQTTVAIQILARRLHVRCVPLRNDQYG